MTEYINNNDVRLPRHKYFALHPDKIREGYYRGQTEEKDMEEKPLAPANIMINTRKKRDFTKSMNYHSTKKRNDYKAARVMKEALRHIEGGDIHAVLPNETVYDFDLMSRLEEQGMLLG